MFAKVSNRSEEALTGTCAQGQRVQLTCVLCENSDNSMLNKIARPTTISFLASVLIRLDHPKTSLGRTSPADPGPSVLSSKIQPCLNSLPMPCLRPIHRALQQLQSWLPLDSVSHLGPTESHHNPMSPMISLTLFDHQKIP